MSDTLAEQPPAVVLDAAAPGASGPGSSGADPAMDAQSTPPAGLGIAAGATATGSGASAADPARSDQDADVRITGPSLSPSRAADFMTCPLLYRFRVLDRLPEPPSPAAARGTLVHAVLERLFDEPAAGRTPAAARTLLAPQWERLAAEEPALTGLFDDDAERVAWLDEAAQMLDRYFTLEDPTRIEPAHREMSVRTMLESGLTLRGYIDRLDIAPTGEIRIVDYKTGTAPREEYEARALFQMKFYAVVLWRTPRHDSPPPAADLPGQWRDRAVRAGRGGPGRHRAQDQRPVAGHRPGSHVRGLAAAPEPALRLVLVPVAVPGLRRYAAAVAAPARASAA